MTQPVFIISEWLPKVGHEKELRDACKKFAFDSLEKEPGCVTFRVTKQIIHPGSPGKTKFTITLMEEFESLSAFEEHGEAEHCVNFFNAHVNEGPDCIVEDWRCRLFSED
jgi:quinol monooxygenase YgiN